MPLSTSSLFTGTPGRPQLGHSIDAELATADQCDMLVSFIKTGGLRLLRPDLFRCCLAEFSSYWENPEFDLFNPARPEQFREAIRNERGDGYSNENLPVVFTLRPYDYQEEILEKLRIAREVRGHHRNLVVAATGTGKTMVAPSII